MQGVVVEDASQIEIIVEASDELAWDVLDAKLFEIMSGGGEPEEIVITPQQWLLSSWASQELSTGRWSAYLDKFYVEQKGDMLHLKLPWYGGRILEFWKGPADA